MFPNRLKLGQKRKESAGLRPTKLTLAFHERTDLENLENRTSMDPVETTEVIKSTPNIQICSSRLFTSQNNTITPFNQVSNRPLSHRDCSKNESKICEDSLEVTKQLSECRSRLQESKNKIEQCRSTITALTAENDSLKNSQKILEAELINCSKDYYERQITRLKAQSQRYQIQNMTNLHKVESVIQEKGQLQASNKKKGDEIRNYMKQVQKERLVVAELKNQLSEKEKTFKFALQESERSNEMLNITHFQMNEKYARIEKELVQKNKAIESLSKQNDILAGRFREGEELAVANRKRYEELLADKQMKIVTINNENRIVIKELEESMVRLKNEVKSLKEDQASRSVQVTKMSLDIKSQQENMDKSLKIIRLQQYNRELQLTIADKDKTLSSLELTLKQYFSPEQYSNLDKKFKQSEDKRMTSAKYYEEKLYNLQKQNEKLRFQKYSISNPSQGSATAEKDGGSSFNEVLRKCIEQNTAMKQQLKAKIDQSQEAMSQMMQVKLKQKKYTNEIEILSKKLESKEKNIKIELQVERQKFTNDLDSLKRKMQTLETRLQYKISENKQKDDFIKNTIIGRSKPSDVPFIVAELERIFLQREKGQLARQ